MAKQRLVHIAITITTLNKELAKILEPRAATPNRRLRTIQKLSDMGVPVSVLVAPIIPVLTDHELEKILEESKAHGVRGANFVMLRLPYELKNLFTAWLEKYYPLKAKHILNRLKEMHGGELYKSDYGNRMRGSGPYAKMIEERFKLACKNLEIDRDFYDLDHTKFVRPNVQKSPQLEMF